jgi:hypothetical protein
MSSGPWTFREGSLARALKAARQAGYPVAKAVINRSGDIELTFGATEHESDEPNPWDKVLIDASHQKRPS